MDSKKDGDKDNNKDDKPFDSNEYFGNRHVPIRGLITELTALCDRASDEEDQSSEESANTEESYESNKLLSNSDDADSDGPFIDLNEHGHQIVLIDELIVDLEADSKNDNACISLDKDIKQDELDGHQIISEVKMTVDVTTVSRNDNACISLEEDIKQEESGDLQIVSDYNIIVDLTADSEDDKEYTSLDEYKEHNACLSLEEDIKQEKSGDQLIVSDYNMIVDLTADSEDEEHTSLDEHKEHKEVSDGEKMIDVSSDAGYKNMRNNCADEKMNGVDGVKEDDYANDILEENVDIMKNEVN